MCLKNPYLKTFCIVVILITSAIIFQEKAPIILSSIKELGWLAPILFLLIYCLATILLLPTMVLTLAGGALFGPLFGTLFNLMGATLGAACAFCISRHLAIDWLAAKRGPKLNKLISGVERRGWQFVALLRLLPIVPFNLVNYGLGITQIKFSHYILTTFIFLTPAEIIYTYCGHAGMDALTHPTPFYKNASIVVLCGLAIAFLLFKFFKYSRQQDLEEE
ncbi:MULTISPECIES: TVP38/TMEM64 family protein [Legionella]|uniref:TVP38/TMEM64 family membrane protein n=1 Tax=Legionella maceachernii TaxID=466 RepID=A0A0W0VWA1_9GAMM|nr:TVP38/TMEM64 family protein [Legionella maceachernii]KTD24567.1 putative integral inner membrane protein [Legionella maceachernii]SJZ62656.1 Uncharacterized membrane protein YdjX, TVP38/TMEM64 family, SNARE-associated domain [Legionella maceachernii]SUP00999.1 TVP38/TMEM64 family inner membrane protein ydjZ [Legionella maceachernii]